MFILTVGPISLVGRREHGAPVERVLHHAAEVPHFGHDLGLAGAVVVVGLGQDGDPLAVGEEASLLDPLREEEVHVRVEFESSALRLAQRDLGLEAGELEGDLLGDGEVVALDHAVHRLGVEEADLDGVGGDLAGVAEEPLLEDKPVLAAAKLAFLQRVAALVRRA